MALNLLKGVTSSSTKLVLRQIDASSSDSSTEMLNDIGTTDRAIGVCILNYYSNRTFYIIIYYYCF